MTKAAAAFAGRVIPLSAVQVLYSMNVAPTPVAGIVPGTTPQATYTPTDAFYVIPNEAQPSLALGANGDEKLARVPTFKEVSDYFSGSERLTFINTEKNTIGREDRDGNALHVGDIVEVLSGDTGPGASFESSTRGRKYGMVQKAVHDVNVRIVSRSEGGTISTDYGYCRLLRRVAPAVSDGLSGDVRLLKAADAIIATRGNERFIVVPQ